MSDVDYRKLRILIADDFSNFRSTVSGMFGKLGVPQVDLASNGDGVIQQCLEKTYDVILCDYDLGAGKNGQQVLEELRFKKTITPRTLFIMVSADAAKDVVMAAYDCEPDDYLMKPITARMLQQRVTRLLQQRRALLPIHKALDLGDIPRATTLLIDLSLSESRGAIAAQKLLGEVFIKQGEVNKAEKLYRKALEVRQMDWARLGLAKVKQLRGDWEAANEALEALVAENPLYLPAYDALAQNWEGKGDASLLQEAVQKTVDISPKSILRQKRLAEVAERNGDVATAVNALRSTVRLGELSCHASPEDSLSFARVAANSIEKELDLPLPLSVEAIEIVDSARARFSLTRDQANRADLLEGRAHVLAGNEERGRALIMAVEEHNNGDEHTSANLKVERIQALQTLGEADAAGELLKEMLRDYEFDQDVLQQLDSLLDEPVSENSRALVAEINREGIDLYNHGRNDEAMACFAKARRLFPKHVGIQLNIVQALIGKLSASDGQDGITELTQAALEEVGELIDQDHPQYERFMRLQKMASTSTQNQ